MSGRHRQDLLNQRSLGSCKDAIRYHKRLDHLGSPDRAEGCEEELEERVQGRRRRIVGRVDSEIRFPVLGRRDTRDTLAVPRKTSVVVAVVEVELDHRTETSVEELAPDHHRAGLDTTRRLG